MDHITGQASITLRSGQQLGIDSIEGEKKFQYVGMEERVDKECIGGGRD